MRLDTGREKTRELTMRARRSCPRVVFSEGTSETILRACGILLDEGIARPILLGPVKEIHRRIDALGRDLAGAEIVDPVHGPRFAAYAAEHYRLRRRQGVIGAAARERLRVADRFGAMMVHMRHADLMIAGASTHFTDTLQAGALTMHALNDMVGTVTVGPLLMGARLPVHLVQYGASVGEVVNLTAVGVVEAMGE